MKMEESSNRLVIVLSEHPVLGLLLTPYIVQSDKQSDELLLIEQAFHLSEDFILRLNDAEQKAIAIAREVNEKQLMAKFTKEKTIARFFKLLQNKPDQWTKVRQYIDEQLILMTKLIRTYQLPVYQKPNGTRILYPHHLYKLHVNPLDVHLDFNYNGEQLTYRLQCHCDGELLSLTEEKPAIAITSLPTTVALGMNLYFFDYLPTTLLMPFTKKQTISVTTNTVDKYIDNILLPIARYYPTTVIGIDFEEIEYSCQPVLYFEMPNQETQLLRLGFKYNATIFDAEREVVREKHLFTRTTNDGAAIYYYYRNEAKEAETIQLLEQAGLELIDKTYFQLSAYAEEGNLIEWINKHNALISEHFTMNSSISEATYYPHEIVIEQSCDKTVDWFELHITVVIGRHRIPFQRFRKHILEGKREYILPDGQFTLLPEEWFSQYAGLLATSDEGEKQLRLRHSQLGIIQTAINSGLKESILKPTTQYYTPKELKVKLRPYQLKGYQWLMNLYHQNLGGCLADDMGLGKTLQTLAFLQQIHSTKKSEKKTSLIVLPTSLMHNWRNEIERFTQLTTFEVKSNHKLTPENINESLGSYQLVLITYGMLRNHIALFEQFPFECIVLDESQNIKNSDSLIFRAVIRLQSAHRYVLTGTPIENSLHDLWTQFHFFQPDLLGTEAEFTKKYIQPINNGDERSLLVLRQLISPLLLRRTKQEVTPELPKLTERIVYCEMSANQEAEYNKEKNSLRHALLQTATINSRERFTLLNGITRLRQLSCHPQLVLPEFTEHSGKMERILEMFETLQSEGHKVLIFSSFVKHLELIAAQFKSRGWKYAWLTGSSSNRSEEISLFSKSQDTQAFFISLKAGGVGLNLVEAGYVFIIDPWWNPAAEAQAIARAHRIGQQKKVIAYRFITADSIEEKIIRLQEQKRHIAESLITESDSLNSLSDQEWLDLLQ